MRPSSDPALRVVVARPLAEIVGAIFMERLGPFAEEAVEDTESVALVFYPGTDTDPADDELLVLLPSSLRTEGLIRFERLLVSRDWVDGWKDHFHPVVVGRVRVRPPWEASVQAESAGIAGKMPRLMDVVINPGLGFGTGLHPTTRGTLALLQAEEGSSPATPSGRGALVDVGTGSGVLALAAAKLGWDPVVAFDNDPWALISARENVAANGLTEKVQVHEASVEDASPAWFSGATVLANMTLEPVLALVRRLDPGTGLCPSRLVVSGILSGAQEERLTFEAARHGLAPRRRLCEAEWVTVELLPTGEG